MTRILFLPLKAEYFDAIVAGTKPLEFRAATPYWVKRIEGRTFDLIEITKGNVPTDVFAIDVSMPAPGQPTAKES
jgi:ASC-1-like (ASCH) protein